MTSFGIFKYMAAYSLVQFTSVLILYSIDSNLTDFQFLYIDLFMISVFAFFFGKTESYDGPLVKQTPLNSLISLSPVVSLFMHLLVSIGFQVVGWIHLQTMEWFEPFVYDNTSTSLKDNLACQQNFTIFIITCFQYVTLAIVFSKGAPYRKSIFTNTGFLISIVANIVFSCYIALYPIDFLIQLFELEMPPDFNFRLVRIDG